MSVTASLVRLVERILAAGPPPAEPFDPEWRSPCELGEPFTGPDQVSYVDWLPLRRNPPADHLFAGLERALEVPVHPAAKAFYGTYWSASLDAQAPDGPVSLIQLWNPEDIDRLVENLIGHALAKRQQRATLTLFIATTGVDSDAFLSIDNATGAVLLETPGRPPQRQVAANLADFLDTLEPGQAARR